MIAQEIMDEYGIEIYIQEECDEIGIDAPFSLAHNVVLESTLDKAMGYFDLPDYLSYLQQTLSVYPKNMFEPFRKYGGNLRILMPNGIREEGIRYFPSGVTICKDGWYNIYIGLARFDIIAFQHELWHAFEHRIKDEFPDAFSNWSIFNPEGFHYLDKDYDNDNKPDVDAAYVLPANSAWFVRNYSVASEQEDRATIFETLFCEGYTDTEYWKQYPNLYKKLEDMKEQLYRTFRHFELLPSKTDTDHKASTQISQ